MAPELVRGERDITPRADVFSLGCVLFQCLTGRPVFEAEDATALLAKILLQEAPRARRHRRRRCRSRWTTSSRACWPRIRRSGWPTRRAVIAALDALGPLRGRWTAGGVEARRRGPARADRRASSGSPASSSPGRRRPPSGAGGARRAPLSAVDDDGLASGARCAGWRRWRTICVRAHGARAAPAARRRGRADAARRRQGDRSGGARGPLRAGDARGAARRAAGGVDRARGGSRPGRWRAR